MMRTDQVTGNFSEKVVDPLLDPYDIPFLFRKHWFSLLAIPPVCCLLALGISLGLKPVYESYATLLVSPEFSRAIHLEDLEGARDLPPLTALKSLEIAVIADSVILRVIDKLKLKNETDFLPERLAAKPHLQDSEMLAYLRENRIKASLLPETRLIEIAVRDRDPNRSQKIADQLAREFESFLQDQKMEEITQSRKRLKEKAEQSRQSALEADEKLQDFRRQHPRFVVLQDHDLFSQRLGSMGAELNQVKREITEFESRVKTLRDLDPAKSPLDVIEVANYKIFRHVSDLQNAYAASVANLDALAQTYTPTHPTYRAALAERENNQKELTNLARSIKSAISANLDFLRERHHIIEQDLKEAREQFDEVKSLGSTFRAIQQHSETEWATHQALQMKLTETDVTGVTGYQVASLISPPLVPFKPVSPRVLRNGAIGGFAGVFISGALLAYLILCGVPLSHPSQVAEIVPGCVVIETSSSDNFANLKTSGGVARMLGPENALIQVITLENTDAPSLISELVRAAASGSGRPFLWLKIQPGSSEIRIQPGHLANLSILTLSAGQALDYVRFPRYLNELKVKFRHIFIDANSCRDRGLEDYLGKLANHNLIVAQYGVTKKESFSRRASELRHSLAGDELSCVFARP